jgi:hypothetical protein
MPQAANDSTLSDRHYITLILRLTLDEFGDLIQGDLTDTLNTLPEHFFGTAGLHQAVETWLQRQQSGHERGRDDSN